MSRTTKLSFVAWLLLGCVTTAQVLRQDSQSGIGVASGPELHGGAAVEGALSRTNPIRVAQVTRSRRDGTRASRDLVRCANLIYGNNKTSVCFSAEFLKQLGRESNIKADAKLYATRLEAEELYDFPFAVMTGEGGFRLTVEQREAMRNYLVNGGFIIASAGCSNPSWAKSFLREISVVFPETKLRRLEPSHAIFNCLYAIPHLDLGKSSGQAHLEGLEVDGKIVLVFSSDGLNDSGKVSDDCCCCGGNEIKNARLVNCNLLAYTLTH